MRWLVLMFGLLSAVPSGARGGPNSQAAIRGRAGAIPLLTLDGNLPEATEAEMAAMMSKVEEAARTGGEARLGGR